MKKIISLLICIITIISLAACGKQPVPEDATESQAAPEVFKLGICSYSEDASLSQITDSLQSGLKAIEKKENVIFDVVYESCNGSANAATQIIEDFQEAGVELMVAVSTPVALAMKSATAQNQLPVVFAAVSDPIGADLIDSLELPGGNITGTTDFLNTSSILDLIFAADPDAQRIGLLYDERQPSSVGPIVEAKNYLQVKGVEVIEYTGSSPEEISLAADVMIAGAADAVFTPTDSTVMSSELSIYKKFADAKIPHYTGADSFALNGAFLGYGVDYAELGAETADLVKEILVNRKDPSTLPVRSFDNGIATINTDICEALGFDIDQIEADFSPFCSEIRKVKTAEKFEGSTGNK